MVKVRTRALDGHSTRTKALFSAIATLLWPNISSISSEDKEFVVKGYYAGRTAAQIQREFLALSRRNRCSLPTISRWLQRVPEQFGNICTKAREVSRVKENPMHHGLRILRAIMQLFSNCSGTRLGRQLMVGNEQCFLPLRAKTVLESEPRYGIRPA